MYRAAFVWWLGRGSAETIYACDFTYRNIDILGILASTKHLQARARASDAKYGYILVGRGQGECTELPLRGGWDVGVQKQFMYSTRTRFCLHFRNTCINILGISASANHLHGQVGL